MVCAKCSISERLERGGEVVIHPSVSYLLDRLSRFFLGRGRAFERHHGTLVTRVDTFKGFVNELVLEGNLTDLEKDKLKVAHLLDGEEYGPELLTKTRTLSQWQVLASDISLLNVLREKRMEVHFQPIVDLEARQIFGYECLSRGLDDEGGLIPPSELLTIARETDLIFELDRLMREMCLRGAHEQGITDRFLFINFLPTSIYNPEFCLQSTVQWADELALDPAKVVFEVVETEKVEDNDHLLKILKYYRDRGFQIALDDVAAGYSGLLQLLAIRPDIMKIDRQLVSGIHRDADKQAMLHAMMNVADQYQTQALVEGVEELEELAYLKSQGVALVQGWLFSKPSPSLVTEADIDLEGILAATRN